MPLNITAEINSRAEACVSHNCAAEGWLRTALQTWFGSNAMPPTTELLAIHQFGAVGVKSDYPLGSRVYARFLTL